MALEINSAIIGLLGTILGAFLTLLGAMIAPLFTGYEKRKEIKFNFKLNQTIEIYISLLKINSQIMKMLEEIKKNSQDMKKMEEYSSNLISIVESIPVLAPAFIDKALLLENKKFYPEILKLTEKMRGAFPDRKKIEDLEKEGMGLCYQYRDFIFKKARDFF
jgi:hypothetical protein